MERIRDESFQARVEEPLGTDSHQTISKPACSQSLYFLFKVRHARVIKNKNRGEFIDRQRKWVGAGEEENINIFLPRVLRSLSRSLSPSAMFSKRTKRKIKQHLCTGYFHTVLATTVRCWRRHWSQCRRRNVVANGRQWRMSAPDEAQKMLCIIASLEFFSCVSTRRLLFHHNCPVRSQRLCVKGRFLCSTFLTRNLNGLVSRRYQGALPPVLELFSGPDWLTLGLRGWT